MKINFVVVGYGETGGDKVVRKYSQLFYQKGNDVIIYAPIISYNFHHNKFNLINILKQIKGTIININNYFIKKIHQNSNFYKIVWKINDSTIRNADATIATAWPTSYDVNKLSYSKGRKYYFIQGYETWDNVEYGKKSYLLPLEKIVISTWIKNKINKLGIEDNSMKLVFNGIQIDDFENKDKNFDKNEINCLMLSHVLDKKGVNIGIKAFEKAKKVNPNLKLTTFGLEKSKFIPSDVRFVQNPTKEKLREMYSNSDIFIYPSIEEGWGLTPIEAMAAKCAVVGTNTGCMIDIGKNMVNSLLCEPNNVDDISNNIIKLSNNKELRKSISIEGYKTVKKLNTWEEEADIFLNILKNI